MRKALLGGSGERDIVVPGGLEYQQAAAFCTSQRVTRHSLPTGSGGCYAHREPATARLRKQDAMRTIVRPLLMLLMLASLIGCAHGPKQRVYPPVASLQEIAVQPDGRWQLQLRLQNFSNVPTTFASIHAQLIVGGQDAGEINATPDITVGPESADVVPVTFVPSLAAKTIAAEALASGQPASYSLQGKISSSKPKREDNFHFESSLNPAPGLRGVLR